MDSGWIYSADAAGSLLEDSMLIICGLLVSAFFRWLIHVAILCDPCDVISLYFVWNNSEFLCNNEIKGCMYHFDTEAGAFVSPFEKIICLPQKNSFSVPKFHFLFSYSLQKVETFRSIFIIWFIVGICTAGW
jgi:hypothetical protein